MAASSVVDSVTAEQLKRAYDLGHKDGLNCSVEAHASSHTIQLDLEIKRIQQGLVYLSREGRRLRKANRILRIALAAVSLVAAYLLMVVWSA